MGLMGRVLVVLLLPGLAVVVVARVAGELDVLVHPEVVLDVLLHVDVTEARRDMGPVCLVVVVAGMTRVVRLLAGVLSRLEGRDLPRLLLGESPLQHGARAGAAGRGRTVRGLLAWLGRAGCSREELPAGEVVGGHQGLVGRHGGRRGSGVLGARVAGGGLGDRGEGGDVGGGDVGAEVVGLVVISGPRVAHQGTVGVGGVVGERGPGVAGETIGPEVGRHPRVGRHPGVQPDPLHHLSVLVWAELWSKAVRGRPSVSNHIAVILLAGRAVGRPAALLKELVSQRRHPAPSGHKLGPVGAGPQPHVVREPRVAGRQRRVRETLHDTVW